MDGHLDTVVMETRKPPRGLAGAPGVAGIDLAAITAPTLVFEGTAREACRAFPANVNVVAAVSLAGIGPDRTRIRIHADPSVDRNRHTVTAEGAFGRLRIEIENVPSENPRTGKLSYLSTIAYLRDLRRVAPRRDVASPRVTARARAATARSRGVLLRLGELVRHSPRAILRARPASSTSTRSSSRWNVIMPFDLAASYCTPPSTIFIVPEA